MNAETTTNGAARGDRAALLAAMADPDLSTDQVAERADGSLPELRRRAETDRTVEAMDALVAVNERRARLILAVSRLDALRTLRRLMIDDGPAETARKAAVDVLSLRWGAAGEPAKGKGAAGVLEMDPGRADAVRDLLDRLDELAREEEDRLAAALAAGPPTPGAEPPGANA